MPNLSCGNEFCMQFHFHVNQSHFHKNGFALRFALKQRHKGTRKWPTGYKHRTRDMFSIFQKLYDLYIDCIVLCLKFQ